MQHRTGCARERERERVSENAFGVKLLHLFTIPFRVYEEDKANGLMYCPRVAAWQEHPHTESSLT